MSKEISIKKSNIILLILDYLQQEGYEKSYIDLEFESGVSLFDYPNEINFLKNLIINGQWNNVFDFLIPMEDLLGIENYKNCLFELKKLIFIETVERENSEVEQLVQMLNELQSLAPNEDIPSS